MTAVEFPSAREILDAHSAALPQPDQLCGPFSASVALAGILDDAVPSVVELALASGSQVWPGDLAGARPPGVLVDRRGWDSLPTAVSPDRAGTDAAGLGEGIGTVCNGRVAVIPVAAPNADDLRRLLGHLTVGSLQFALLANLRTGVIVESDWDVGHFVILWGFDDTTDDVAVADTYAELGTAGMPPGCRLVKADSLADAMRVDGGRGLLMLVRTEMHDVALELVAGLGLNTDPWST